MNSEYKTKIFKFNLIPPKTKEEIKQLEERDNTILYSVLLIFFGAFVYFALTMLDVVLVQPSLANTKTVIGTLNSQISTYNEIKQKNGELFIKSRALDPLLAKDIKLTDLIDIADKIESTYNGNVNVVTYKREITGEFVLTLTISDFSKISDLYQLLLATPNVKDIFVRSISIDSNDSSKLSIVVAFNINKLQ
ncbi:MAG: hypothetical protein ABI721_02035 [Candidatus Dojkabacteria bacterium]